MEKSQSLGILIIRAVLGTIMLAHGFVKIFVYGFAAVGNAFANMGIPLGHFLGPLIALLEFIGGLSIVVGFMTRWVSILFAFEFLVAILKVHIAQGFFIGMGADGKFHYGFEYALLLLSLFVSLIITDAGKYSVDFVILKRKQH